MTFTSNPAAALNKPILREGSRGEAVRELQELLTNYCVYSGAIDGIFGSQTTGAVRLFQYRVFLKEDGVVADKTWRALYKGGPVDLPTLKRGSTGDLVVALQQRLDNAGVYEAAFDGVFGPKTEAAVKTFQRNVGLIVDGIVGDRTWQALSNLPEFGC